MENMIRVNELLILENRSGTTLAGTEGKKVLSFTLPEGFFAPQFTSEIADAVTVTDQGFDYIRPVNPGELQVGVSYHLKISSLPYTLSLQTNYPTLALMVLTDAGMQIVSDTLISQPPIEQGGQQFRPYVGENFDKGTVITAKLTRELQDNQRQGLIVSVIVGVLIVGGISSVYFKKWLSKGKKPSRSSRVSKPSLKQEREELIRAIAELDDRFEEGHLSEEIYHKERARKKKRLIELTRILSREQGARGVEGQR